MKTEPTLEPPVPAPPDLPPAGDLEEQTRRQMAFLTQGVMECVMRATGDGAAHPPAAPDAEGPPRSAALRDAAHLSNAAARLMAAWAKVRGEYHFTYTHEPKAGTPAARRKGSTSGASPPTPNRRRRSPTTPTIGCSAGLGRVRAAPARRISACDPSPQKK